MPDIKNLINDMAALGRWMAQPSEAIIKLLEKSDVPRTSFIDGDYVDAPAPRHVSQPTPLTGQNYIEHIWADEKIVHTAVQSSRSSFVDGRWSKLSAGERGEILVRLSQLIAERADDLAILDAVECGKPFSLAKEIDVDEAVTTFKWYGELCGKMPGSTAPKGPFDILMSEPVGVCACVAPFNYPLMIGAWKIAPMLAAGNTVVLKPSEKTPGSVLLLARLATEAGMPPGTLNVVVGDGPTAGQQLASHLETDAIGFTGSSEVGLAIAQAAYFRRIKLVFLECGGKSPAIVFDDANIDAAVEAITGGVYYMSGQSCSAPTRAIVHKSVLDDFVNKIEATLPNFMPNNPLRDETEIGALISKEKYKRVCSLIESDIAKGGKIVAGQFENLASGSGAAYVTPVCILPSDNNSEVVQSELFAPVLSIQTFESYDEAIELANSTKYGLWASASTNDLSTAKKVSDDLSAGTVAINDQLAGDISTPMGGVRSVGLGKDRGTLAYEKYRVIKHVSLG